MLSKVLLEVANLVAESIRPRRLRSRAAPELPPAGMAATELLAAASGVTPQELALRQRYQHASEEAVRGLQRHEEILARYRDEDERRRARLAEDANRLGRVESANGNAFYFGRRAHRHDYTPEEAASMEARIRQNIAKANLLTEFTTPHRFSGFPYC